MRLDARKGDHPYKVLDASKDNAQIYDVVWVDDVTNEYGLLGVVQFHSREIITKKSDQLIIISTGLRMVWINVKPPEEASEELAFTINKKAKTHITAKKICEHLTKQKPQRD